MESKELKRKQAAAMADTIKERILQLEIEYDMSSRRAKKAINAVEFSGYEIARKQQVAATASLVRCNARLKEIEAYIKELDEAGV